MMQYRKATFADIEAIYHLVNDYATDGVMLARSRNTLYETLRDMIVAVDEEGFFHNRKFLTVSIIRAFSAGVPTVMRRHPSQPGMRERLRTMMPASINAS